MSEKQRLQLENELLMTCSKAQAINKYIDELEESSKLSELWCKSQQENQELKKKYENAVTDYENTMAEKNELKKKLEELELQNFNLRADIIIQKMAFPNKLIKDKTFYDLYDMSTYEELLAQQKEFINYLEDEIKNIQIKWGNQLIETGYIDIAMTVRAYQIILQKYKEIIGDDK